MSLTVKVKVLTVFYKVLPDLPSPHNPLLLLFHHLLLSLLLTSLQPPLFPNLGLSHPQFPLIVMPFPQTSYFRQALLIIILCSKQKKTGSKTGYIICLSSFDPVQNGNAGRFFKN